MLCQLSRELTVSVLPHCVLCLHGEGRVPPSGAVEAGGWASVGIALLAWKTGLGNALSRPCVTELSAPRFQALPGSPQVT